MAIKLFCGVMALVGFLAVIIGATLIVAGISFEGGVTFIAGGLLFGIPAYKTLFDVE